MKPFIRRLRNLFGKLKRDRSGNLIVEFAYMTPIALILTVGGAEVANYAIVSTRISQLAIQVADNASRIGEGSPLAALKVYESNINDVLTGAGIQAGTLNIYGNYNETVSGSTSVKAKGRIVISSLEPVANPNPTNKFKIGWQRCRGNDTSYAPQYGVVGAASGTNMDGMGPAGRQVKAPDGTAVIFVEVHYRYEPLLNIGYSRQVFGTSMSYQDINAVAAMIVRDDRDTSQIYPIAGETASTC